ncbi:MAG: Holliday junction branch migration protein RuvA [Pseudomonadales bacterium]|jgi:Holliday junction DNA helicase RuvA|nr:Holliday junction branch migration protein RuvA [Pseudomonadales bacterium]
MIAYLEGSILQRDENSVLIKTVSGVGYRVLVSPGINHYFNGKDVAELYIYSHIREDRFELYGFLKSSDLKLCELLLTVSGCGPKMAQLLLDNGADNVIKAVQNADIGFFTSTPRVGKKLAQKLIIDLKTKLGGLKDLDLTPKSSHYQDVFAGLSALGFADSEIERALGGIDGIEEMTLEAAIKEGIKNATKR